MITIEVKIDEKSANEIKALLKKINVHLGELKYGETAFDNKGIKGNLSIKDNGELMLSYKYTDGMVKVICEFIEKYQNAIAMAGKAAIATITAILGDKIITELKEINKEWCE